MPSYICERCGCVDNSACGGNYWNVKSKAGLYKDKEANEHLLCVECTPNEFSDGSKNEEAGKWHNQFKKKHWSDYGTMEEIIEVADKEKGSLTNAREYFKRIRLSKSAEDVLDFIYNTYVIEDDSKLDESAKELKQHYKFVLEDLMLHDVVALIREEEK